MSQRWEAQLLEAIGHGDEAAFKRIYDLYHQRVRLAAWRISHRADWVDDITSETWCRAYAQRLDYDAARPFLVWMSGIVRNVYREHCRKSPLVLRREDDSEGGAARADDVTPEKIAEEAELLAALSECVNILTADEARIVHLRFFEGLTLRDVGKRLGVAESTLRDVRIPTIFRSLRKCLESKGIRLSEVFPAQDAGEDQ